MRKRTIVYIDGFNLYYGCLRASPSLRWLDPDSLVKAALRPEHNIHLIRYFTARIDGKRDPDGARRQDLYLRALQEFLDHITIHFGHFSVTRKRAPDARTLKIREILNTEEKGSDVNLAVHLLNDAWLDPYDCAVLISNDSDLGEALALVKHYLPDKTLGLLSPLPAKRCASSQLSRHADFIRTIRRGALKRSQLPDHIPGTRIRRPRHWN